MLVQACRLEISPIKERKGCKVMENFMVEFVFPVTIMFGIPAIIASIIYVIDVVARFNGHAPIAFIEALFFDEPIKARVRVKTYRGPRRIYVDKTKVYRRRF